MTARIPLYLAGASREHARVAEVVAALDRTCAFDILDRWWTDAASWTGTDATRMRDEQHRIAAGHFAAISRAKIFWWLYPQQQRASGSWVEYGHAIGTGCPHVIVTGEGSNGTVFSGLWWVYRDVSDALGVTEAMRIARAIGESI